MNNFPAGHSLSNTQLTHATRTLHNTSIHHYFVPQNARLQYSQHQRTGRSHWIRGSFSVVFLAVRMWRWHL